AREVNRPADFFAPPAPPDQKDVLGTDWGGEEPTKMPELAAAVNALVVKQHRIRAHMNLGQALRDADLFKPVPSGGTAGMGFGFGVAGEPPIPFPGLATKGTAPADHLFSDLLSYAPGLNTSTADIAAVLDAEARSTPHNRPGSIAREARALID